MASLSAPPGAAQTPVPQEVSSSAATAIGALTDTLSAMHLPTHGSPSTPPPSHSDGGAGKCGRKASPTDWTYALHIMEQV